MLVLKLYLASELGSSQNFSSISIKYESNIKCITEVISPNSIGMTFTNKLNFFLPLALLVQLLEDNMLYLLLSLLSVNNLLCNFKTSYRTCQLMCTFYVCIFLGPSS